MEAENDYNVKSRVREETLDLDWDCMGHHERRMSCRLAFFLSLSSGGDFIRGRSDFASNLETKWESCTELCSTLVKTRDLCGILMCFEDQFGTAEGDPLGPLWRV